MNAPIPMLEECHLCDAPDPAVVWHAGHKRWTIACCACERGVSGATLEEATHRWNLHPHGPGVLGWIFIALCAAFVLTLVLG